MLNYIINHFKHFILIMVPLFLKISIKIWQNECLIHYIQAKHIQNKHILKVNIINNNNKYNN